MIAVNNKVDCCGCTACFSVCPKSAITMQPDEEGFLYPVVNAADCIECGLCEKVCPIIHNQKTEEETVGYIIRNQDAQIVFESTSGGAFTVLAEYVLQKDGVVYGAGYDDSMLVICKKASTAAQLFEMRGSKFVQSTLGDTFVEIKQELNNGTYVLFSGTPCQIAGLLGFLGEKPNNLLCVDFVCRGVPSPKLWKNYVAYMEQRFDSKMIGARFKHKTYGYHTTTMKIDFENGKTYYGSGRVDPYMRAFVKEMASRPSCSDCAFKSVERPSDITIFDCYEYTKLTGKIDDDRGYTSILVHSQHGKEIFEQIKPKILWSAQNVEQLVECNGIMVRHSAKPHDKRDEFYQLAATMPIDKAMARINPITMKDHAIEKAKRFLFTTGTIKYIRKLKKKHTITVTK